MRDLLKFGVPGIIGGGDRNRTDELRLQTISRKRIRIARPDILFVWPALIENGDAVVVYGKWIIDTEHGQYCEIHPVTAYYILSRNSLTSDIDLSDSSEERAKKGLNRVTNDMVTEALVEEICKTIHEHDEKKPPDMILRTTAEALSYGMTTRYSGGRFAL